MCLVSAQCKISRNVNDCVHTYSNLISKFSFGLLCAKECKSTNFWLLMKNSKFEVFSRIIENSTTTIRIGVTLQNWLHYLS